MKKSIILFVVAVTFPAPGITAYPGNPVDENGMPFGNGFSIGHYYYLNNPQRQGHFTCPTPEYVGKTKVYGKAVFVPRGQGNDPVSGEASLWP
jgi:hypothetical protein